MGELSPDHERHGLYVEVSPLTMFAAPTRWHERARELTPDPEIPVVVLVPHPNDVLLAKLERSDEGDLDHIRRILSEYPLNEESLHRLATESPYRSGAIADPERLARFEWGLKRLGRMVAG